MLPSQARDLKNIGMLKKVNHPSLARNRREKDISLRKTLIAQLTKMMKDPHKVLQMPWVASKQSARRKRAKTKKKIVLKRKRVRSYHRLPLNHQYFRDPFCHHQGLLIFSDLLTWIFLPTISPCH